MTETVKDLYFVETQIIFKVIQFWSKEHSPLFSFPFSLSTAIPLGLDKKKKVV